MEISPILQIFNKDKNNFQTIKFTADYAKLSTKIDTQSEELISKLKDEELVRHFKEIRAQMRALENYLCELYYEEEFRFGALIGLDIALPKEE